MLVLQHTELMMKMVTMVNKAVATRQHTKAVIVIVSTFELLSQITSAPKHSSSRSCSLFLIVSFSTHFDWVFLFTVESN